MKIDTAINNALIITPSGRVHGSLGISDGHIAAIQEGSFGAAANTIDAGGRVVLPGLVEPHCHFWDPGATDREDWAGGTAGAAAGGITTVIEMPLSLPPTVDADGFRLKRDKAKHAAHVDYLLWGGVIPASTAEIHDRMRELHRLGAVSYKVFMCHAAKEFPACDDGILYLALQEGARLNVLMGIHAENDSMIEALQADLERQGRNDPLAYAESRPEYAEQDAIERVLNMAAETHATIYIVHMSLAAGAERIKKTKQRGQRVYVETCPQYLTLDLDALRTQGPWAKCAPPLRDRGNQDRMWDYVLDGTIDTIGSDHAPFTREEKLAGRDKIWLAPNGMTGIQTMLPLILDEGVHRRGLSLEHLSELMSTNSAKIFGLYPRKGILAVGSDADITLVDMDAEWTITGESLLHKSKWTPYEGRSVKGRVDLTMVRGQVIYRNGELVGSPGFGQFLGIPTDGA